MTEPRIIAAIERKYPGCRVVASSRTLSRAIVETPAGRQFVVAVRVTAKTVRCRLC